MMSDHVAYLGEGDNVRFGVPELPWHYRTVLNTFRKDDLLFKSTHRT